jgi:2-keto-3-deoxy-galactonokinase
MVDQWENYHESIHVERHNLASAGSHPMDNGDFAGAVVPVLQPSAVRQSFTFSVRAWLRLAAHPRTAKRAFTTALIVGIVLIAINHGSAIISGQFTRARLFQMCLTILVPYIVSTVSSVATRSELGAEHSNDEQI